MGETLEKALVTVGGLLDANLARLTEVDKERHKSAAGATSTSGSANIPSSGGAVSGMGPIGAMFSNSGSHNNSGTNTPMRVASD